MSRTSAISPDNFTAFGDLLKHLRKQAGLTQLELSIAVGYSDTQISRMEQNQRVPDAATLTARFVPALHLEHELEWVKRLLGLAADANYIEGPTPTTDVSAPPLSRHNLPQQITRFFGRETDIAQLRDILGEQRLVTLTGAGGVGKTRLSLQIAESLLTDFADGIWLVELAPLADSALIVPTIATIFGLREMPGLSPHDLLIDYLRAKHLLLILDNCEHLIDACARLTHHLLRGCPHLKIIASSREALGIVGETVYPVPSLSLPDPRYLTPDTIAQSEAIQLFLDRARASQPKFAFTETNASVVAQICQRLDGIPLALELASARVKVLTVEQIAARLDDRFRLLTGGSRNALPRHQTLHALIDWSYDLLPEPERALLRQLSVFAGGWTLEAAEAICAGPDTLELLSHLVDKSLVLVEAQGDKARYHLLETIRQYAAEKLVEAAESASTHTRHRDYFLRWVEANPFYKKNNRERHIWRKKLEADLDNVRRALDWSFSDLSLPGNAVGVLKLVIALFCDNFSGRIWSSHQENIAWFNKAVTLCQSRADVSPQLYAQLLSGASVVITINDPQTALTWAQQAVATSRELGSEDKDILIWSLLALGERYWELGEIEQVLAPIVEAEAIFQDLEWEKHPSNQDLRMMAVFASAKARAGNTQARYHEAKMYASESIRLNEAVGNTGANTVPLLNLGIACLNLKEYDQARQHFQEAGRLIDEKKGLADEINISWAKADVWYWLGITELRQGNLERALEYCQTSVRLGVQLPDHNIIAHGLEPAAIIAAKQGQSLRAARLSGASQALYQKQGRKPTEDSSLDMLLPGWRDGPEQEATSQAYKAGQAMTAEQAAAYVLIDADV